MVRFGKYTPLVCILSALVILEFAGLVGVLLENGGLRAQLEAVQREAAGEREPDGDAPAWLEAAPEEPAEKTAPAGELTAREILSQEKVVAHGLGAVDGTAVLNCLEGFQDQYARGVRVFEVDLRLTRDQRVVLRHDWRAGWQHGVSEANVPTLEEFLDKRVLRKYTPLSFQDLLLLMEQYPDICIITDSKFTDAEIVTMQFESMLQDARELGLSYLFGRMVIQVYSPLMYRVVDRLHHFDNYIYTLYAVSFSGTEDAFREQARFCENNGILGITMWDSWWSPAYADIAREHGVKVFAHTVNEPEEALALLESGVSGIYTDYLTPRDLGDKNGGGIFNHGPERNDFIQ